MDRTLFGFKFKSRVLAMAVAEGDVVFLVFRGEGGKLKVSGRVVAAEEDTVVVCGFPDKFGSLEELL